MNDATAAPNYAYLRARITVQLRTMSPLHCGDGQAIATGQSDWREAKGTEGHINTVCRVSERPYIPASTLRGSLRERCANPARLFGTAHGDQGTAGALRVYDAFLVQAAAPAGDRYWKAKRQTTLRDGVAIDPITGSAASGKLFTFEIVPQDSLFEVEIEADRVTRPDIEQVLNLIAGWNGGAASALGRGRSKGWGRTSRTGVPEVKVLELDALAGWVTDGGELPWTSLLIDPGPAGPDPGLRFEFVLRPTGPLLVNEPGRVPPAHVRRRDDDRRRGGNDQEEPAPVAALAYLRAKGDQALVPGAGLRGAVRAQARRILATIAHRHQGCDPAEAAGRAEGLVRLVFGWEGRRSLLWLGDAVGEAKPHDQVFSAIDRFTAAVATEKMTIHSVEAASCTELTGTGVLDSAPARHPPGDWWKALLLLLARDLYAGDLVLGWGKSRGYGACAFELRDADDKPIADFDQLLAQVRAACGDPAAPTQWLDDLHQRLAKPADHPEESRS